MSGLFGIKAISFDLDDTLWPVTPVLQHAERCLHAHLQRHHPNLAARFDDKGMQILRDRVLQDAPELAKDVTRLRKTVLARAARESGEDEARMETAFEVFLAARNRVRFYPDVLQVLRLLRSRYCLGAITNGNADIARTGLSPYFSFAITVASVGEAKPHPETFLAAAKAARVEPGELLHVGDDPETDIGGAFRAGVKSVWINRTNRPWPAKSQPGIRPDARLDSLEKLPALLGHGPDSVSHDTR